MQTRFSQIQVRTDTSAVYRGRGGGGILTEAEAGRGPSTADRALKNKQAGQGHYSKQQEAVHRVESRRTAWRRGDGRP